MEASPVLIWYSISMANNDGFSGVLLCWPMLSSSIPVTVSSPLSSPSVRSLGVSHPDLKIIHFSPEDLLMIRSLTFKKFTRDTCIPSIARANIVIYIHFYRFHKCHISVKNRMYLLFWCILMSIFWWNQRKSQLKKTTAAQKCMLGNIQISQNKVKKTFLWAGKRAESWIS